MASAQWARLFITHGHSAHSVCSPNTRLESQLKSADLPHTSLEFREYFSPTSSYWLRQFVKKERINTVFVQNLRDLWLVSPALWGLPVHLVGFAQMWLSGINKKDPLHTLIYNRLDTLVTLTPSQQIETLKCIPVPQQKTITLPNSIDTSLFGPKHRSPQLRKDFGADDSDILIGCVGRIDRQKGQIDLLEAFAQLQKSPIKTKLVLIGEATQEADGLHYEQELKATVQKYKLEKQVTFAGFRKNIPEVMASLDIFVLPSHKEAFGFVVVEALASGTPIVATHSGGVPDILENGKWGALVKPQDPQSLAQALTNIIGDVPFAKKKALTACDYARDTFDETQVFLKLLKHLETKI